MAARRPDLRPDSQQAGGPFGAQRGTGGVAGAGNPTGITATAGVRASIDPTAVCGVTRRPGPERTPSLPGRTRESAP